MQILFILSIISFVIGIFAGFFLSIIVMAHAATQKAKDEKRLREEIARNLKVRNERKEQEQ